MPAVIMGLRVCVRVWPPLHWCWLVGVPRWHVAIHFRLALCRLHHWHGHQIYIFGDVSTIPNPDIELTVRVHDECNGSDVFGSDICTCRPYLIHGIEECIRTAQKGGCVAYDVV